jgi:type IV fimbrial biogenesis protein FimT
LAIHLLFSHILGYGEKMLKVQGFTLTELMITLVILAILLALALPSFEETTVQNRLATESNRLLSALTLAHSEAVKRNRRVVVCESSNGSSCTGNGNWRNGWLLFVDNNNNGNLDAGEEVLRTEGQAVKDYQITNANSTPLASIFYDASGRARATATGALAQTTFVVCRKEKNASFLTRGRGARARLIVTNIVGRAEVRPGERAGGSFAWASYGCL